MPYSSAIQTMPPDASIEIVLIILCCLFVAALIVGGILYFKHKREEYAVSLLSTSFSRKRKRSPLIENVSVVMSEKMKDELLRVSGGQQSKYIRASVRLALPVLKTHPSLIDILEKE
ncbi:hypothetical protein [Maridesulfovibrio ferrireducens]|uniref:hypothetical protein n=1 Tax=Maridesulfovibrio ferrireducens TaxID=246191 RepID=UPI001A2FE0A1|nr:hypothetical protein [Maridesulfovibrio ferrireducens]MBI9111295.1 hypothetical protein [Maridesulfovibrio ferrireducens]